MTFQSTGYVMAVDPAIQQSNAMLRLAENINILIGVLNRSHIEQIEPLLRDMRDTMKCIEQLHREDQQTINKWINKPTYTVMDGNLSKLSDEAYEQLYEFINDHNVTKDVSSERVYDMIMQLKHKVRYGTLD